MKNNIKFKNIRILSLRDQAAYAHDFSEGVNFIYGTNDVGKSSLIKTLYYTLGGDLRLDDAWKADDIISQVEINNGKEDYVFLRYKKLIGVLNKKSNKIKTYNSIGALSLEISDIFCFKLELHNKYTGVTAQANPACLFAPFFIDQDEGWKAVLNSFEGMTMYSEWQKNILNYHSGIKPKEYYTVLGKIKLAQNKIAEVTSLIRVLQKSRAKIEESFGIELFDVDIDFYKSKLERILESYTKLNSIQTDYRLEILGLHSKRNFIESELKEIASMIDSGSGFTQENNSVESSIAEYKYLANKDVVLKNITILTDEKGKIEKIMQRLSYKLDEAREESKAIENLILDTKSEMTLKDVIKSAAYHEIESTFRNQMDELSKKQANEEGELIKLQVDLEFYNDKKRTASINCSFKQIFEHALKELGVENTKVGGLTSYNTITKGKTGSRGPRGIFAFHYALLRILKENQSVENMPIVIDSPKQQDLDKNHTHKLIELCLTAFSKSNQIIIGTVGYESFMDGFPSVKLENEYHLLGTDCYEFVYDEIMPVFERAILER